MNDGQPFDPALLERIVACGGIQQFARGHVLFEEEDAPDGVYVLLEGELKVYAEGRNRREVIYGTLRPIELFGEMLLDGGTRSASVKAVTDVRCAVIDGASMRSLVRAEPDFAEYLILRLISRLRTLSRSTKRLATDQVHQRVISLLEESAVVDGGVRKVPRLLTQQEIADRVGASREMVNHVLRDLTRAHYIARDRNRHLLLLKPLPPARPGPDAVS